MGLHYEIDIVLNSRFNIIKGFHVIVLKRKRTYTSYITKFASHNAECEAWNNIFS